MILRCFNILDKYTIRDGYSYGAPKKSPNVFFSVKYRVIRAIMTVCMGVLAQTQ